MVSTKTVNILFFVLTTRLIGFKKTKLIFFSASIQSRMPNNLTFSFDVIKSSIMINVLLNHDCLFLFDFFDVVAYCQRFFGSK
jgi:hypothetical protein